MTSLILEKTFTFSDFTDQMLTPCENLLSFTCKNERVSSQSQHHSSTKNALRLRCVSFSMKPSLETLIWSSTYRNNHTLFIHRKLSLGLLIAENENSEIFGSENLKLTDLEKRAVKCLGKQLCQ